MFEWVNKKETFRDYTDCQFNDWQVDYGIMDKIVLKDGNKRLMIKFENESYKIKNYISEFIASEFIRRLGYDCQEVSLGYYEGRECCAVTLFDYEITPMKEINSSAYWVSGMNLDDKIYDLDWLLSIPLNIDGKLNMTPDYYLNFIYNMFSLDMLIGNFDRHAGNWGYYLAKDEKYCFSGLYDNGNSLNPKYIGKECNFSRGEIEHLVKFKTKSSVLFNKKRSNFFKILENIDDRQFLMTINKIFLNAYNNFDIFMDLFNTVVKYNEKYESYCNMIEYLIRYRIKEVIEEVERKC